MIKSYSIFALLLTLFLIITGIVYLFSLIQERNQDIKEREMIYKSEIQKTKFGIKHEENKIPAYYRMKKFESVSKK
jgi:hypothetical protein